MKKARKAVRKFKRIYKLKEAPTSYELKQIIKKFGFTIYGYSENEDKLIETKTYNLSKEKYAFTYIRGNQKYVFYDDLLNEVDTERALAHEVAHLYYNHFYRKITLFDSDVNKEWEANLFAAYLLEETDTKAHIIKLLLSLIAAALFFFSGMNFSQKSVPTQTETATIDYVYITPTGHNYHSKNCLYGKSYANSFEISRQVAEKHYLPCALCNPDE